MAHDIRSPALDYFEARRYAAISRVRRGLVAALGSLILLILLGAIDAHDRRILADDGAAMPIPDRDAVSLDQCPGPGPGFTDTLVMVLRSQADLQPTVTSCARIAERSGPLPLRAAKQVPGGGSKPVMAEAK